MSNLILTQKDIFRAERLFTERIVSPISNHSFNQADQEASKSISRLISDTKKYRVVQL